LLPDKKKEAVILHQSRGLSLTALAALLLIVVMSVVNVSAYTYPYQDPGLSVAERVRDLLARMTLEEKVGQMIQTEWSQVGAADLKTFFLGALLNGGGNTPLPNTPAGWCDMIDSRQKGALATRLQIPLLYGTDAVHGHNNVGGATIFPHNIGLGAAGDPELVERIGGVVAAEVRATGVHWTFGPCITVPQNEKWGRTYEGFSEDTGMVSALGAAFVKGAQGADLTRNDRMATCLKHYIGDGATEGGVNAGDALLSDTVLRSKYLPPYIAGIKAGARTVMVSYNKVNGVECHANAALITDLLKQELQFDGFVVSDYDGIDDNDRSDYQNAVKLAVNAGIDMIMVSRRWRECLAALRTFAGSGAISLDRIDDAVRRILRVKFQLGLFEKPYADRTLMANFGSEAHRAVAREAVRKSLVLLKNDDHILPLAQNGRRILVAGKCADNLGYQCGGWTITWQGRSGNITAGTTILEGIRKVAVDDTITYRQDGSGAAGYDVAIVVIGEKPYAAGYGDSQTLALDSADLETLRNVKAAGIPTVTVLVSGRPLIVTEHLDNWDAFVAAWLPGTEGQGVAEVLFGVTDFSGKLPFVWPQTAAQLPISPADGQTSLFALGAGMTYSVNPGVTPAATASSPSIGNIAPTPTASAIVTPDLAKTTQPTNSPASEFVVTYQVINNWDIGATVNVILQNNSAQPVNGWNLAWEFADGQMVANLWNGIVTQSGVRVTVDNASFNREITANGGTVSFGFNLFHQGVNTKPTGFTLNGVPCQAQ
jgi:beta-glucosidase